MEAHVTINKVFANPKTGQKGPYTVYNVKGSDEQTYGTFNDDLGRLAQSLEGQSVIIIYHQKQSGQYTNNIIDHISSYQGEAQAPLPQEPNANVPQTPQNASQGITATTKDRSIAIAYGKDVVVALIGAGVIINGNDAFLESARLGQNFLDWVMGEPGHAADDIEF